MANVLDFQTQETSDNKLRDIFKKQHELALKYIPIEVKNGLCLYTEMPVDLDNAKAQARIKDMTWRCVEEVAEALDALEKNEIIHFYEEMADALHFLVEKCLLCGYKPQGSLESLFLFAAEPINEENYNMYNDCVLPSWVQSFIKSAGMTCNCLKNKPWKQTQMLTDKNNFMRHLDEEFRSFIKLCNVAGFTPESLFDMYMRKNQVNHFRQKSNY